MTGVAVYLKYPTPGKVKTRLAASIGDQEAAGLYSRMIAAVWEKTLRPLPQEDFAVHFLCDPYRPLQDYQERYGEWAPCSAQSGGDLGERLKHSFSSLLAKYDEVITIGTDCVDISDELMREARAELRAGKDLVLGPATDGGYYLIGLRAEAPALFEGQAWSTPTVLSATLDKAAKLGLQTHLLACLSDIDTLQDLEARTGL